MLTLIAAHDRNGAIGKDNDIPWRAPEDLAFFQRETTGGAVVMGRRTWESLPVRPLKNRLNLVVSSDPHVAEQVLPSPDAAVDHAHQAGYRRVYGIGGAGIYRALLPVADRLLLTEVDLDVAEADAFFPAFDRSEWHCLGSVPLRSADPACVLFEYLRCR
ncbi:dihydrofolate reductase [Paracoccus benzoatiresistens]|uniref:Dihydrofolate reductase n=1 Tax=Paracoccus benzoatiresistens TaxID=2997341 RepID=A0ABT4J4R1_9RHOB|nr:dihydrofolate reductase [Paracoccus sp. EF6]MCZ0961617.1 dihydrofolate reductase [Paracoccus sp. EF6]